MAKQLEIRDFEDALLIRTEDDHAPAKAVLSALVSALFVGFVLGRFLQASLLIPVAVLVATLAFLAALGARKAELRVTNLEFESRGDVGDGSGSTRTVCRADVRWLEHQDRGVSGLYAVLRHHSVCMLPYVDEQQAMLVIERIVNKFPDFEKQWEGQSPFGKHFTELGLSRPN
ncbi:MAG TPA: hypothetical protein VN893_24330 [Bryobacteraceae bacterium]|nr:hypothetical protein [Bryobacteraceae bacterium]